MTADQVIGNTADEVVGVIADEVVGVPAKEEGETPNAGFGSPGRKYSKADAITGTIDGVGVGSNAVVGVKVDETG